MLSDFSKPPERQITSILTHFSRLTRDSNSVDYGEAMMVDEPNFSQNLSIVAGNMTVVKVSNLVFCPYNSPEGYRGAFSGDTDSCTAAAWPASNLAQHLVENHLHVKLSSSKNPAQYIPMMFIEAAFRNKGRVIEYLLENEKNWVNVNSESTAWCSGERELFGTMTALWVACYTNNVQLVDWLIEREADLQLTGDQKTTPLQLILTSKTLRPYAQNILSRRPWPNLRDYERLNVEQNHDERNSQWSNVDMRADTPMQDDATDYSFAQDGRYSRAASVAYSEKPIFDIAAYAGIPGPGEGKEIFGGSPQFKLDKPG